jgi:hypothetical protein
VLNAARNAGVPIPDGDNPSEAPDFIFRNEGLGIEISALLRSAESNGGIAPVEEAAFQKDVVRIAQAEYLGFPDFRPVRVIVYFPRNAGERRNKRNMARSLANFVRINRHRANPVVALTRMEVPDGFGPMSITAESDDWFAGESGGINLAEIPEILVSRISAKNKLVPKYRSNLPKDASVWLLLHSGVAISRTVPIPYGINELRFEFDFDRVFWLDCLHNKFVELLKSVKRGEV